MSKWQLFEIFCSENLEFSNLIPIFAHNKYYKCYIDMPTLNLSIDLPVSYTGINVELLKTRLTEDPFAELDESWGGDRDANDIANELHDMRTNTRTIETLHFMP